jgi:DMSO/TMAO reductase YedYZ molybdopterin-dependent catalytic subunit
MFNFDSVFKRKSEEERMEQEGRLPPGQSLTQKFPVLHYGPVPQVDLTTWDFKVWGEVESSIRWTWDEFNQLPRTSLKMYIHCVTKWSKFDTQWEGVSLRTLIEQGFIKPLPSARYLLQHAEFGFTANLPLEVALQDNFLLATHFEGEPITPEHGYPVRGIVGAIPERKDLKDVYFWKGAKWLRGLQFMASDQPGFWERAGYHNEADIWDEQRFSD